MNTIDAPLRILWDYLLMHQTPRPMDAIFAFGSNAMRVAEHAADLYAKGYGKYLIVTGGNGADSLLKSPEAEIFAEIAKKRGVPGERILIENRSSNTGENIAFSQTLIRQKGLDLRSFLLVHKPYMERRSYATFRKQWPEAGCIITSPPISYEEYRAGKDTAWIHVMVGAVQRMQEYSRQGFQIPQEIPEKVWEAYCMLVQAGYTRNLIDMPGT